MAITQNKAVLPQEPFSRTAVATTAETAFHAPTNVVDLLDAADNLNGARITRLYAIPRAQVAAACNVQLYKRAGSTYTLIDSVLMATVNPSGSVANGRTDFGVSLASPMELEAGVGLAVAIGQTIANGVVVRCEGGLY